MKLSKEDIVSILELKKKLRIPLIKRLKVFKEGFCLVSIYSCKNFKIIVLKDMGGHFKKKFKIDENFFKIKAEVEDSELNSRENEKALDTLFWIEEDQNLFYSLTYKKAKTKETVKKTLLT